MTESPGTRRASPVSALAFMYWRTTYHRLRSQIAKVRNPRYLVAVLIGALYIYWILFSNTREEGRPFARMLDFEAILPVLSALILVYTARWWIFGADRSTLAFAAAEIQFLFPAPVSRRSLIHAKLVRTQFAILLNTLIFTILFRSGGGSGEGWRRGVALWIGFSVVSLHRLGASLVRANAIEHTRTGWKRSVGSIAVFGALLGAVVWGLVSQLPVIRAAIPDGFGAVGSAVVNALQQPLPAAALWPVRVVLAPIFAPDTATWLAALPFAVAVLLVNYIWVVRLDASFEEAAIVATQYRAERIQRFRSSQGLSSRSKKGKVSWIPSLSLRGVPAVAVAWKNVAAAIRGGAWRTQLIAFGVGLLVMAVVIRTTSKDAADTFIGLTVGWGGMLVFLGPTWMRFDLRLDLPRLEILKTWPLPGRQIVAAEIAAVTTLHTVTILTLMSIPIMLVVSDPELISAHASGLPVFLAVAIAVPVVNALMFTVQNGMVLLFPAWVKLGVEARGFETMGQNLLTIIATLFIAAVAMVFPVGVALLVLLFGGDVTGWTLPLATLLGGIVLLIELWPAVYWLGDLFDQMDVSDVQTRS